MSILYKTDVIDKKNKVFAYFRENPTEKQVREELKKSKITVESLIASGPGFMIFQIEDGRQPDLKMTDLTTSYGASSLEVAPSEITDPEPKPKTTRRRRTRKTTTKTTK